MFFWSWSLTKCWFSNWIADSCQVNLSKTGQDCSEAGLRIKSYNFFFYTNVFLLLYFVYMVIIKTQNRWPNKTQKTSPHSYKIQLKINSTFSWVSLIGLWTTRPRSYAFSLCLNLYIIFFWSYFWPFSWSWQNAKLVLLLYMVSLWEYFVFSVWHAGNQLLCLLGQARGWGTW